MVGYVWQAAPDVYGLCQPTTANSGVPNQGIWWYQAIWCWNKLGVVENAIEMQKFSMA